MEHEIDIPRAYFVGGVNGVGKSTFLTELTTQRPEFTVLKGSSAFMEWLGIKPGDYNSLRALPDEHKRAEFDKMMTQILTRPKTKGKILLIDAHYFHYNRGNMVSTTGDWIAMTDALFVVNADTDVVMNRVVSDDKERDLFPENSLASEQVLLMDQYLRDTIQKARELSEIHNVPLFVIKNKQDDIEQAVADFMQAHSDIMERKK